MKIAIVSAVFGSIDTIKPLPAQDFYIYDEATFTEHNSVDYPFPNLNNRLRAKYFKTQMHRALPDYDLFVWLDGKIKVHSPYLLGAMIRELGEENDIAVLKHSARHCIYQEIDYIEQEIFAGNKGLIERYADQPIRKEVEYYRANGYPENNGLFDCSMFIVRNTPEMNELFNKWWDMCLRFSYFDQIALPFLIWKNKVRAKQLVLPNYFFETVPHLRKKFWGRLKEKYF